MSISSMPFRFLAQQVLLVVAVVACASCSGATSSGTPGGGDGGGGGGGNACGQTNGTSGIALCGACVDTYCCTEILACASDAQCPTLQTCLQRCQPTDRLCTNACSNLYPGGVMAYNNLANCSPLYCGQACSTPPSGCANVPLRTTGGCGSTSFPRIWDCPDGPPEPQCVAAPDGTANRYCCLQ